MKLRPALFASLLLIGSASQTWAQSGDKASAVLLFDEASKLSTQGKFADACPKYAESERLDPQLGTLLHLADCYEKNGQTASAWAGFRDAVEMASKRSDPREKIARKRIAQLEGKVPKLIVDVPADARIPGLKIERDGSVVSSAAFGVGVPSDPGTHVVTASAPGKRPWSTTVTLASATSTVKIPVLESEPIAAAPAKADTGTPSPANATAFGDKVQTTELGPPPARLIGYVLTGAGAVGLAVGGAFFLSMKSANDDAKAICPDSTIACPIADAIRHENLISKAKSARTNAIIASAAGGVAIATGLVLVFTASPGRSSTSVARVVVAPAVGTNEAAINVSGAW